MNALSKAKLTESLCDELSIEKTDAKDLVDTFFEVIRAGLESGSAVKLSGFGNFMLRDKPERPGRNPKTGENVPVLARRVVTFKPGLKLKQKVELH